MLLNCLIDYSDNEFMKKAFLALSFLCFCFSLFSIELPESLCGIWEGKDRFVFFENNSEGKSPEIVIILKEYYGWYFDRAAEPESYKAKENRRPNAATHKDAEHITFELNPVSRCILTDNVWELTMRYSKRDINFIPIAIVDNKMYLNFFIKDLIVPLEHEESEDENENPYNGLWRGNCVYDGIKICTQVDDENIGAYYIWDDKLYDIRYWKSDMDFSSEEALYSKNDVEFYVDKHLFSSGKVYSCTSGKSKKIRNPMNPFNFNPENYIFNEDKTLMVCDKEPYLVKIADKKTMEDLMKIVKDANSRRKPKPDPLFPPSDVDWHWDLIDELEKNNPRIQEVRQRQAEFGPRGKDFGQ